MIPISRALISVSDKSGVAALGRALRERAVEILSTGGTARHLRDAGIEVTEISAVTKFPECLDGRVKTLHPRVHGGILADRDDRSHREEVTRLDLPLIDLVVVNLYPFEKAASRTDIVRHELIEEIDIGGPTLLRAAAKNSDHVVPVCDPEDYPRLLRELARGGVSRAFSHRMAIKVFERTAYYDAAIARGLRRTEDTEALDEETASAVFPERLTPGMVRAASLRYGENPHQKGAFYRPGGEGVSGLAGLRQLQGKELSYNNYLDMDAALRLVNSFSLSTAVVMKHLNPCGVGFDDNPERAYRRALAADPLSAFGGIVALNRPLTVEAAQAMSEIFLEVILAPEIPPEAAEALRRKRNLRLVEVAPGVVPDGREIRSVAGGWLVQTPDSAAGDAQRRSVAQRPPTEAELRALERAWIVVRHAKSNAIVLGSEDGLLGLGCGQTSRVDAVRHAAEHAARNGLHGEPRVLASDAFFPFRDGVDAAAEAGVTAVIQPGGSVRDKEVITAADEHGMAMIFTGRRCFRH